MGEEIDIDEIEKKVSSMLSKGKNNGTIKFLLEDPPIHSKDDGVKVRCVYVFVCALLSR